MKKGLIFVLGIISFLGINTVSADTINFTIYDTTEYELLQSTEKMSILENKFSEVINSILKKHEYFIARIGISGGNEPYLVIYGYDYNFTTYSSLVSYTNTNSVKCYYYFLKPDGSFRTASESYPLYYGYGPLLLDLDSNYFHLNNFYFTNMEITYDGLNILNLYIGETLFLTLNPGDIISPYKDVSTFIPETITCESWDFGCKFENDIDNVSDLFESPLNFLESIWTSISSIFQVIFEFFALLPTPMQGILYTSFMIAIFLGVIKLIL